MENAAISLVFTLASSGRFAERFISGGKAIRLQPLLGLIVSSLLKISAACAYAFVFNNTSPRYWRAGKGQSLGSLYITLSSAVTPFLKLLWLAGIAPVPQPIRRPKYFLQ